ncbi:MAG: class I tRNA ligase family protein [Sphingomonadaceae bacterium]
MHIGHAYETIAADVMARFQRAGARCGSRPAPTSMASRWRRRHATCRPRALADETIRYLRDLFDHLNISYDRFIRTTEDEHHRASQAIWQAMEATGDLYQDRYEGWYSIRDEAYYDESERLKGRGAKALRSGHAGRMDGRGIVVLQAVEVPAAAARSLSRQSRIHPPGIALQRGSAFCGGRPARSFFGLAHQFRLGVKVLKKTM